MIQRKLLHWEGPALTHDAQLVHVQNLAIVRLDRTSPHIKSPHLLARIVVAQRSFDRGLCLDLLAQRVSDRSIKVVKDPHGQERVDVTRLDQSVQRRSELNADAVVRAYNGNEGRLQRSDD